MVVPGTAAVDAASQTSTPRAGNCENAPGAADARYGHRATPPLVYWAVYGQVLLLCEAQAVSAIGPRKFVVGSDTGETRTRPAQS